MVLLIIISFVIATICYTLSISGIFEKLRSKIEDKNMFLGNLIRCPYCLSHYITPILLFILCEYGFRRYNILVDIFLNKFFNFIITCLFIISVSAIITGIILKGLQPLAQIAGERRKAKHIANQQRKVDSGVGFTSNLNKEK